VCSNYSFPSFIPQEVKAACFRSANDILLTKHSAEKLGKISALMSSREKKWTEVLSHKTFQFIKNV